MGQPDYTHAGAVCNNMATSQVTVSSAGGQITAGGGGLANRGGFIVNTGPSTVYLGQTSAVTSANGFPLVVNNPLPLNDPRYQGPIFGVTSSGTSGTVGVVQFQP